MEMQDKQLLNVIRDSNSFTAIQLAKKLGVSEKTARERLKRLEREVSSNGGEITSKSGRGYQFRIVEAERFSAWLEELQEMESGVPTTTQERINYILHRLLYAEGFVKLDELCGELFISRTTMTSDMKQVKNVFAQYDVKVLQRPGHGVCLQGDEFGLRNCMVYDLLQRDEYANA